MKLFQYWDLETPPDDVADLIDRFRVANPDFDHILLNERSALELISAHYGATEIAAFKACNHPAMQADYLRLCLMDALGGLYIDVDQQPRAPLSELIDGHAAIVTTWCDLMGNGVLMFREPRNPFISACLALATDNILNKRFTYILMATGPGLFNAVRSVIDPDFAALIRTIIRAGGWLGYGYDDLVKDAHRIVTDPQDVKAALETVTLVTNQDVQRWIDIAPVAYKATDRHWLNWTGSIYR